MSPAAADASTTESRWAKRRRLKLCQKQQDLQEYTGPTLTEDIWCHIHSLMPLRDAARAACVSRTFRWSWGCLPNLTFSRDSLGWTRKKRPKEHISKDFAKMVDRILKNHSRTSIRTLELCLAHYNKRDYRRLDRWLQMAVIPGIQKLRVSLTWKHDIYRFPCSNISDGRLESIRHLQLSNCSFCPTPGSWCSRNLVILNLKNVQVEEDGLSCVLSSSSALERLSLKNCCGIFCLKIPGSLKRLGYVKVADCDDIQVIESKAPSLSTFNFEEYVPQAHISLGEALRVNELHMDCSSFTFNTRAKLQRITPDSKTIGMHPSKEMTDAQAEISNKSANLERLYIKVMGITPFYLNVKYCALEPHFGASHSVEDFVSYVSNQLADHVSFFSALRGGRTSARSAREKRMVEGACRMLKAWLS